MAEQLDKVTLAGCGSESQKRVAISRAYYAAFHAARSYLQIKNKWRQPTGTGVHEYTVTALKNFGDKEVEVVGAKLDDLRKKRRHADYDPNAFDNIDKTAMFVLRSAKTIIENLGRLVAGNPAQAHAPGSSSS